jgi:hypothetical protein
MTSLITRHQLISSYPVPTSRPGLRNWIKRNGFPAPIYANANTPLWSPDDVAAWFANRPTNHHDALAEVQAA